MLMPSGGMHLTCSKKPRGRCGPSRRSWEVGDEVGASYVIATLGFGAKGSNKPCWVRTWSDLSFQTIILALVSAPALVNFPLVNTHLLTSKRFRQCLVGREIVKFITFLVRPLENYHPGQTYYCHSLPKWKIIQDLACGPCLASIVGYCENL